MLCRWLFFFKEARKKVRMIPNVNIFPVLERHSLDATNCPLYWKCWFIIWTLDVNTWKLLGWPQLPLVTGLWLCLFHGHRLPSWTWGEFCEDHNTQESKANRKSLGSYFHMLHQIAYDLLESGGCACITATQNIGFWITYPGFESCLLWGETKRKSKNNP